MKAIVTRKVLISMIFIGLTLLGIVSYRQLKVELFPNAESPYLVVQVSSQTEVDPGYMEKQAVIPIEGAVGGLPGIKELTSTAAQRRGTITVAYEPKTNLKYAQLKLQERIDAMKGTLPSEFTVTVMKVDLQQAASSALMTMEVRGAGGANRVRQITDEKITPRIENVDGIAGVTVYGGQEKTLEITLDKDACDAYGITPFQVRNAIAQNGRDRTFAGRAFSGNKMYFVHVTAEYIDPKEIESIVIKEAGPVLLKDVASVYFGVKEQTSYSRVNGMESVTVNLVADSQVNIIEISHSVKTLIEELNKEFGPLGIEIKVQENLAETMEKNIDSIIDLAITGGLLAMFILWIFLKNGRLVLSIALAIPISVYVAFNAFYAFGITINSLTLVGMALAIGMLVDNSVVVLENVYRHAARGESPDIAVTHGTSEVWRSVVASTLTTVTVFLPFLFSENYLIRTLGTNVGISIISTLLISLMVALLLIPMLTHFTLLRNPHQGPEIFEKISLHKRMVQIYTLILKSGLRNPAGTVIGAMILFFITLFAALALSNDTLKEAQINQIRISITMPQGTTLDKTDLTVKTIEERLMDLPEKEDLVTSTQEATATVTVKLFEKFEEIKKRKLPEIKADIENKIRNIPQITYEFQQSSSTGFSGGGGGGGVSAGGGGLESLMGIGTQQESVIIKGQNFDLMKAVAEDVKYYLDDLTTIQQSTVSVQDNRPEVRMAFNTREMGERNVSLSSVMSELSSFPTETTAGVKFKEGTEEYDILIKYDQVVVDKNKTRTMTDLQTMDVPSTDGSRHRLTDLAKVYFAFGMGSISRLNQEKQIKVTYRFDAETNGTKTLLEAARGDVDNLVSGMKIPAGVAVEVQHEVNQFADFYFLIAAAFILIFMIMAAVFESLSTPFVLLLSIPLAGIGSFLAILFTGTSLLNANTLIGFIILIGIVVNNGIILIDYANILRKNGNRKLRALMTAGLARLRPILITACTTCVAMVPLAMGESEYVSLIGKPFAITVIGGLALSTLLTLVFIPTFYSGLENALKWMREQKLAVKIVMYTLMIGLTGLIYFGIDAFLWQAVTFLLVLIGVPASIWFVLNSLRKASDTVIPLDEKIIIRIQNLVKIYERDGRFNRQWKAGLAIRKRLGMEKVYKSWKDLDDILWEIPILGFMMYFVYFFLEGSIWIFLLSIPIYFMMISTYAPVGKYLKYKKPAGFINKLNQFVQGLIFWGFPAFSIFIFQLRWENIAIDVLIGLIWYLALIVYTTSSRLAREKVNVNRITGKFGRMRRGWYRLVQSIPLIGTKKKPFKALRGVSMTIENGMFGLLGPNGAGKTTLMRIICGIFEQSYGKIWISGIDTQVKREELQGLIGYLPQEFGMYENMTAGEYLNYQGILKGLKYPEERDKRVDFVLSSVHMLEHKNEKIGSYSGGMKQRIGIAQILLHLPRILVVDEPTAGLDPRERIRFRNLLVELSRERVVIFSTHIIEDISSSCNKVAVLDKGDMVFLGAPEDMALTAKGHVWQVEVSLEEFDRLSELYKVVHHMRDGQNIRVRLLAETKPSPDAIPVQPLLEDSYLWMLKKAI